MSTVSNTNLVQLQAPIARKIETAVCANSLSALNEIRLSYAESNTVNKVPGLFLVAEYPFCFGSEGRNAKLLLSNAVFQQGLHPSIGQRQPNQPLSITGIDVMHGNFPGIAEIATCCDELQMLFF